MKKLAIVTCIILVFMLMVAGCSQSGAAEALPSGTPQSTPEVRIENGVIQWRSGEGEWQDIMTLEALKAKYPEYFGATPTPESTEQAEDTSEPTTTPAATSSSSPTKSSSGSKATATPKPTTKATATPKVTVTPVPQSSDSGSSGGSSSGDGEDIGWSDDQL